jgi:hypothetical protein
VLVAVLVAVVLMEVLVLLAAALVVVVVMWGFGRWETPPAVITVVTAPTCASSHRAWSSVPVV